MFGKVQASVSVLALILLFGGTCEASLKPVWPGQPRFDVTARLREQPHLGGDVGLVISVPPSTSYPKGATATVRVQIPEGINLVSGDLSWSMHPSMVWTDRRDNEREIRLLLDRTGEYAIHVFLRVEAGGDQGIDEMDLVMPITVRPDTVLYSNGYPTRIEAVRQGRRYRYAGRCLVPIDSSESIVVGDIEKPGVRVLREEVGHCGECGLREPVRVPFLAIVGSDGKLRSAEYTPTYDPRIKGPLTGPEGSPLVRVAREALSRWQFAPARAKGRPVAHCLEVQVTVAGA